VAWWLASTVEIRMMSAEDKYCGFISSVVGVGQFSVRRLTSVRRGPVQVQSQLFPQQWPVAVPSQKGILFQRNGQWYYAVRAGETPAFISLRATGTTGRWKEFLDANGMRVDLPPFNGNPNTPFSITRDYTLAWPTHWPKELRYA